MKGISTTAAAAAVIAAIIVLGAAFFFLSQQPATSTGTNTGRTTTSSTSSGSIQASPPPGVGVAFGQHFNEMAARDIPTLLTDYQDNAVVSWSGNTGGLGGVYNGVGNIRLLYSAALSTANTISLSPTNVRKFNNSATQVTVNSTITMKGTSKILGDFNGTITSSIVYTYTNGGWKIITENWDFKVFNYASAGGSTTFPEWQKVGPPISTHRGPDWLHNFAWDYGGPGVAVMIYAYIAALAVSLVVLKVRRP